MKSVAKEVKKRRFAAEVVNAEELADFLRKSADPSALYAEEGQLSPALLSLDLLLLHGKQVLRVKTGSIRSIEATESVGVSGELQATIDRLLNMAGSCEDTPYADEYKKLAGWLQELRLRRLGKCSGCVEVKNSCTNCGDPIPKGHGIRKGDTLVPVCTRCQAHRMLGEVA